MRPWMLLLAIAGCHNPRPIECQRLKQCCSAAGSSGSESETVRAACMRKDDSDALQCKQLLDQVRSDVPGMADRDECKVP
jgi:hypothetical protein